MREEEAEAERALVVVGAAAGEVTLVEEEEAAAEEGTLVEGGEVGVATLAEEGAVEEGEEAIRTWVLCLKSWPLYPVS